MDFSLFFVAFFRIHEKLAVWAKIRQAQFRPFDPAAPWELS